MASGDRAVGEAKLVRLPSELWYLIERYQKLRRMTSFTAALKELLETHPAIANILAAMYAETDSTYRKEDTQG